MTGAITFEEALRRGSAGVTLLSGRGRVSGLLGAVLVIGTITATW